MSTPAPPATPERKPRCRMFDRLNNRCENESIDSDPKAPQVCARHALEGARLLAEAGVITYRLGNAAASVRRTA